MRNLLTYICVTLSAVFLSCGVLAGDCNDLKESCQRCQGAGYIKCRHGFLQSVVACGANKRCVARADGCNVDCVASSAVGSPASSGQLPGTGNNSGGQKPAPTNVGSGSSSKTQTNVGGGGKPCTTGNKGESVPDGCGYCMSDMLLMKCLSGVWQSPKTCDGGRKCKGGLSEKLKVACDGRCE